MNPYPESRWSWVALVCMTLLSGLPAAAQEGQEQPPPEAEAEKAASSEPQDAPRDRGEGDETAPPEADFTPSETISEDLSVPFPVDI